MDPDNECVVFFFVSLPNNCSFEKRKSQVVNVAVTFENTAILPPRAHSLFIQRTGPGCKTPELLLMLCRLGCLRICPHFQMLLLPCRRSGIGSGIGRHSGL